jgi:nucleoside-diphosphate kinase
LTLLAGRIMQRFESKGLRLARSKFTWCSPEILNEHYAHIASKPFYPEVYDYMTSAPVFQMVFQGPNAVAAGRVLLGANPWTHFLKRLHIRFLCQIGNSHGEYK